MVPWEITIFPPPFGRRKNGVTWIPSASNHSNSILYLYHGKSTHPLTCPPPTEIRPMLGFINHWFEIGNPSKSKKIPSFSSASLEMLLLGKVIGGGASWAASGAKLGIHGAFTYIYHTFWWNVGRYAIHGASWIYTYMKGWFFNGKCTQVNIPTKHACRPHRV